MNPPSALHGAMSRDRKPFTYTPGGLDLSEIKSERMAKRLMRNAMNQGVPEVPVQSVHSSSNNSAPVALPNYNCLPVQVFPTFNLPSNPKTLLRTRSNPDPRDAPIQRVVPPPFVNNGRVENNDTFNKTTPTYPQSNNNRPASMYEYNTPPVNVYNTPSVNAYNTPPVNAYNTPPVNAYSIPRMNYGSDGYTAPVLPEISYEAEYFCAPPKVYSETEPLPKLVISEENDKLTANENTSVETSLDLTIKPLAEVTIPTIAPIPIVTKPADENMGTENEQREVKVVKKQVKGENKVEEQNGNQNGDGNVEAEMTVKLPTKKSAAKTETKVEVVKNVLPDGTVEEVKTTTTKTTIDGRTEIKTKTETTTFPKEEAESEEEIVEEEEEEDGEVTVQEVKEKQVEDTVEKPETTVITTVAVPKENGLESKVVKTEERSETTTTKKVVVVQDSPKEEQSTVVEEEEEELEEEEEEVEETKPTPVVVKKLETPEPTTPEEEPKPVEEEEEVEEVAVVEEQQTEEVEQKVDKKEVENDVEVEDKEEVEEEEDLIEVKKEEVQSPSKDDEDEEEVEDEEEFEEAEEKEETEAKVEQETEVKETKEEEEEIVEETESEKEVLLDKPVEKPKEAPSEPEEKVIKVEIQASEEPKSETNEDQPEPAPQTEYKIPIREPSIPLDKVEDVEIKPIGSTPIITKTHTENTEIITSTIDPKGGLSTQTEYNKIENIVTVNRTTKILDHNYENLTQQGIPTVKTYFPPPSIDRISTSPFPSRPYQPVYTPEPTTERRHSLLLERLSMERQMPTDILQYGNQANDQPQYQDEPQSEVLTVSNVKPSSITNQQWFQQTKQQNVTFNNVATTPTPVTQPWTQTKPQPQPQQQYQPQPQYQTQPQYQAQPQYQQQPQYQPSPTPQPQYQPSPTPQPQYQPSPTPQPQYQYTEPSTDRAPSSYSTYTPTPSWVPNTAEPQQNITQSSQYSYLNKDSYQRTTQPYSSSYVPPPWEQDSSYTSVNNTSQIYYQPAPQSQTQSFSPAPAAGWKPPPAKFSKTAPISYIPPAPNQSFVRSASVTEPPRTPGRKTYYSEYERRYITVPESTYIPTETKYQPQPDPSPQYYYDNNEPSESVEPQWRRELREFTEKTSQTTTTEQTNVQPPWEADTKYAKTPSATYTPTPTWSQTLRPRSWRERSFESEYVSQEWPKTNTLGRGRPLSTLGKSVDAAIPERARGVSVDRYNPNNYQPPAEHPPVQSHTLTTPLPHAGYHNPNVPAYHARASAEPRELPTSYQQRVYREARASPLQSRSFKYLQWITGTEN